MDDQTDNQTIYLAGKGSKEIGTYAGTMVNSSMVQNMPKQQQQKLQNQHKLSRNQLNEQFQKSGKNAPEYGSYHLTQPVNEKHSTIESDIQYLKNNEQTARIQRLTLLKKDEQEQYQSFGKIGPSPPSGHDSKQHTSQPERAILIQQQNQKTIGQKTSNTALVDHDNGNQSPHTYTNLSYTMDHHKDVNLSAKNKQKIGTSIQESYREQMNNPFSWKQLKCDTNRKTQELIMQNSNTINNAVIDDQSKNSVTYKRLNEDLDLDFQKAKDKKQMEDILDSSVKNQGSKSTLAKHKKKLS